LSLEFKTRSQNIFKSYIKFDLKHEEKTMKQAILHFVSKKKKEILKKKGTKSSNLNY